MSLKKGVVVVFLFVLIISIVFAIETSTILLKVSLNDGEEANRKIWVSGDKGEISLEVLDIKGVSLDRKNVRVDAGERAEVLVSFNSAGLNEGIYTGRLKISNREEKFIPLVLELESENVLFDINVDISPQYTEVSPGEKILAQIKVFDLVSGGTSEGFGTTTVDIEYMVLGLDGRVFSSEMENLVIDQKGSVTKTFMLPDDIPEGVYVFASVVSYGDSTGVSSKLFIVSSDSFDIFGVVQDSSLILVVGAVVFFFFLIIVFLFVYMMSDRNKLIEELKRYNAWELKKQKKQLLEEAEKAKGKEKKRKARKDVSRLKKMQRKRIRDFKDFERKGDVESMRKKIKEWKGKGYNTANIERIVKGLSSKDMREQIGEWKKQGYKGKNEGYKKKK
ncbi:hypothetical protein CO155_03000 [Candidatus Pacearchaeota archaeon CG_4_9_14_3_um_filter_35_19]|nr:MAG: hypothetical protein AUJ63_01500 [Candidatus Pacearchaeota archaeon CG1_02_35_32]PJA69870.1 MAG: hypothetical protein CO155_03000 [Candidatus Pacearchaeota archaeon CG_4_9_14_3_um_filter_35_19]